LPVSYTTAVVALVELARVSPGDKVLVLAAAGGIGLASIEIARHVGAKIIAAAGGKDKGALALRYGASAFVDYREPGWSEAVLTATGGSGPDIIVDPVGGDTGREALRALARGGRYLIVGFSSGTILQIPANRLLLKRASAIGVYWDHDRDAVMLQRVKKHLTELLQEQAIRPHIGASFAFEDLPKALMSLRDRQTTGKIVLQVMKAGPAA
jgi:NADPH2:quinone reductase